MKILFIFLLYDLVDFVKIIGRKNLKNLQIVIILFYIEILAKYE